jgi:hypothetical protein
MFQVNLTGRTLLIMFNPTGMPTMLVLSLQSDSAVIVVTWARIVAMLAFPNVIVLLSVIVAPTAPKPRKVLLLPVVLLHPAHSPMAVLQLPVVDAMRLCGPMLVLPTPILLAHWLPLPMAIFALALVVPVLRVHNALEPIATLKDPVVLVNNVRLP